jgi:hypothetical protein
MAFGLSALLLAFPWFALSLTILPGPRHFPYRIVPYLEGLDRHHQLPTAWMRTSQLGYSNL